MYNLVVILFFNINSTQTILTFPDYWCDLPEKLKLHSTPPCPDMLCILDNQIITQTVFTFPDVVVYGSTTLFANVMILSVILSTSTWLLHFRHIGVICLKSSK